MTHPDHRRFSPAAAYGAAALDAYAKISQPGEPPRHRDDPGHAALLVTNLLYDLMRLAREVPVDFEKALDRARVFSQATPPLDPFPGVEISSGRIRLAEVAERELVTIRARLTRSDPAGEHDTADERMLLQALSGWRHESERAILRNLQPRIEAEIHYQSGAAGLAASQAAGDFPGPAPTGPAAPQPPGSTAGDYTPPAPRRHPRGT